MEDNTIVQLYLNRDESAIKFTKDIYGKRLNKLAYRILLNYQDSEECEQDTYLKAWNSIPPNVPKYFFAYLAKICRFIAMDKLDWKNAKKRKAEIVELTQEMELCIPNPNDTETIDEQKLEVLLNNFLSSIKKENRVIFIRRYWFADSIKDISQMYKISESKVKSSLLRTRNKLKLFLESEGEGYEW